MKLRFDYNKCNSLTNTTARSPVVNVRVFIRNGISLLVNITTKQEGTRPYAMGMSGDGKDFTVMFEGIDIVLVAETKEERELLKAQHFNRQCSNEYELFFITAPYIPDHKAIIAIGK